MATSWFKATGTGPTQPFVLTGKMQRPKGVNAMVRSMRHFAESEVARERLRIIEFYEEFGEKATKKAFGIDRKTLWVWKKRIRDNKGHIASLAPQSTRPKTVRQMRTDPRVLAFIHSLRMNYPRLGKEKITPLVDEYCREIGIPSVKESTIGKIIQRNKFFFQKSGKIYHDPSRKQPQKKRRVRVRRTPKDSPPGYVQMDTVLRFVEGIRVYLYSAIDISSKFAFSLQYKSLNSSNTVDFFKKVEHVFPYPISTIQTDNGLEFLGDFEEYVQKKALSHVFIYPRCCKVNGVVERYQRSLQEEFLDNHLEFVYDPTLLNDKLIEYLLFYNTKRVHKSLGLKTPVDYLISKGGMSNMSMTRTTTCKSSKKSI